MNKSSVESLYFANQLTVDVRLHAGSKGKVETLFGVFLFAWYVCQTKKKIVFDVKH